MLDPSVRLTNARCWNHRIAGILGIVIGLGMVWALLTNTVPSLHGLAVIVGAFGSLSFGIIYAFATRDTDADIRARDVGNVLLAYGFAGMLFLIARQDYLLTHGLVHQ